MTAPQKATLRLEAWARTLQELLPEVKVEATRVGLRMAFEGKIVRVPVGKDATERSFLNLETGTLRVQEDGVLLLIERPPERTNLTPFLSALLARLILPNVLPSAPRLAISGPQLLLSKEWSQALGTEVTPVAVNKLLKVLRLEGAITESPQSTRTLKFQLCLDLLARDFRLPKVGRAALFFATNESLQELQEALPGFLALGATETLSRLGGGWVEPRDILIAPQAISTVRSILGASLAEEGQGAISVRKASRVPLELLALPDPSTGGLALNPILAMADALGAHDPIVRELGSNLMAKWKA